MSLEISSLCQKIKLTPLPVIFLDTCSILDIIRCGFRENIDNRHLHIVEKLTDCSTEIPQYCWLVTCETVENEWEDNIGSVKKELEEHLKRIESHTTKVVSTMKLLDLTAPEAEFNCTKWKLTETLQKLSSDILKSCKIILTQEKHEVQAMRRLKSNTPPAKRGKESPKDCEIISIFFDLCRTLREEAFTQPIIFVTSNSEDFGKPRDPSNRLLKDFQAFDAKYVSDLSWATHEAEN